MPRYKVTELSYFDGVGLIGPGSSHATNEIEFDGVPGYNLEPLDAAAKKAKAAAEGLPGSEKPTTEDVAGFSDMSAAAGGAAQPKNDGSDLA